MSSPALFARWLRIAFDGEPLHGPAFRDTLIDLTPAQAASHPVAGAHSAWEIALHVAARLRHVRLRLLGGVEAQSSESEWPTPPPPDAMAWQRTIESLEEAEKLLRELLIRADARRFTPGSGEYDAGLHDEVLAALMHVAWHGGQVTLLRRAQGLQSWNYNRAVDPEA